MSLLSKLLNKRGVNNLSDLSNEPMPDGSPSEKQQFEHWQRILSTNKDVTVDNLVTFCEYQLKQIDSQLESLDNKPTKIERLVLVRTVYKKLIEAIKAPQTERESLENYLNQLLDS